MTNPLPKPSSEVSSPSAATSCGVLAYGVVRIPFPELAALRKAPGPRPAGVEKIPLSLLKHADQQTLLALAAVLKAAQDFGLDGPFRDWGVIAAPRFLGRIGVAGSMFRFRQTGASGVSPLIIPTMSLHAVAGSVSMVLKAHALNYGVGGGPGHLREAMLAGLAAREEAGVSALWVVATGFDPEPIPDVSGDILTPSTGYGVALALTTRSGAAEFNSRLALRLVPDGAQVAALGPDSDAGGGEPLTPLITLADALTDPAIGLTRPGRRWQVAAPGLGVLVLEDDPAQAVQPDARRAG